jgi:acyl-CoA hydrolase
MMRVARAHFHLIVAAACLALASAASAAPVKVTVQEAAALIGRKVYFATGSATPTGLIKPIRDHALKREGRTDAYFMSTFASGVNFKREYAEKFHSNLLFISMSNREAASGGWATLPRDNLFNLGKRLKAGEFELDTVVVRVSPPDEHGMVSLGTTGDVTLPAIEGVLARGGKIIAEVNPNVPRTHGTNQIAFDKLAAVVESNEPLSELSQMAPNPVEAQMAKNIARLVPNRRRATVQVGIGGSLSGLGVTLKGKRLRIFSEMGTDAWVLPLMKGEKPEVREATFSFLHGTNELYKFADNNDRIQVKSALDVNDPEKIAEQKRMRAINTALEVDLSGNTNAEQIGPRVISAAGGQPNFMEGASKAKDGKAIMALRSTNKFGETTIVLKLQGPVTTPAGHVDHVVTEWGATESLRGMAMGGRAYQLIAVAHPMHRKELADKALADQLIDQKQYDKLIRGIYHAVRQAPVELRLAAAEETFKRGLITEAQHQEIVASVPAQAQQPQEAQAQ